MVDPIEVIAAVACTAAARRGEPIVIEWGDPVWSVRGMGTPPLPSFVALATIQPGETPVGLCKKLATMRQLGTALPSGVTIPAPTRPALAPAEARPAERTPEPAQGQVATQGTFGFAEVDDA